MALAITKTDVLGEKAAQTSEPLLGRTNIECLKSEKANEWFYHNFLTIARN